MASRCAPSIGIPVLLIGITVVLKPFVFMDSINVLKLSIKSSGLDLLPSGSKKLLKALIWDKYIFLAKS